MRVVSLRRAKEITNDGRPAASSPVPIKPWSRPKRPRLPFLYGWRGRDLTLPMVHLWQEPRHWSMTQAASLQYFRGHRS
jgi:hypothetical protein